MPPPRWTLGRVPLVVSAPYDASESLYLQLLNQPVPPEPLPNLNMVQCTGPLCPHQLSFRAKPRNLGLPALRDPTHMNQAHPHPFSTSSTRYPAPYSRMRETGARLGLSQLNNLARPISRSTPCGLRKSQCASVAPLETAVGTCAWGLDLMDESGSQDARWKREQSNPHDCHHSRQCSSRKRDGVRVSVTDGCQCDDPPPHRLRNAREVLWLGTVFRKVDKRRCEQEEHRENAYYAYQLPSLCVNYPRQDGDTGEMATGPCDTES